MFLSLWQNFLGLKMIKSNDSVNKYTVKTYINQGTFKSWNYDIEDVALLIYK